MGRQKKTPILTSVIDSGGLTLALVAPGVDGKVVRVIGFRLNSERGACVSFFEKGPRGDYRREKSLSGRVFVPARGKAEAKPAKLGWFETTPGAALMYEADGPVSGMIRYILAKP